MNFIFIFIHVLHLHLRLMNCKGLFRQMLKAMGHLCVKNVRFKKAYMLRLLAEQVT